MSASRAPHATQNACSRIVVLTRGADHRLRPNLECGGLPPLRGWRRTGVRRAISPMPITHAIAAASGRTPERITVTSRLRRQSHGRHGGAVETLEHLLCDDD